jgi:hypothetical protein
VHRAENRGGLSGAVVDGFAHARGAYLCVLDADLQHPPACIPALLREAQQSGADVVIASRYVPGGSAGGLAGPVRQLGSRGLKLLSKLLFPRRLAGITDPLGGYFLLRRAVLDGVELRPTGYKVLLEILIRCPWRSVREVPYQFEPRLHGDSKADLRQMLRFLEHLRTLAWDCAPGLSVHRGLPALLTLQALDTTAATVKADPGVRNGAVYPAKSVLGAALADAAVLLRANLGVQTITLDVGNWDMHSGLGITGNGWMATQLADLAGSLAAFATDLGPLLDRVTVLTISEFGRRVTENGSGGVDHGHGNAVMLLGGGLLPGVHGTWPGLADANLDQGDLAGTTDYRNVLAEYLVRRMGVSTSSLPSIFPGLAVAPVGAFA